MVVKDTDRETPSIIACPFCGGEAEIHKRFNSLSKYVYKESDIPKHSKIIRYVKTPSANGFHEYWEYKELVFIPRCKRSDCLGRITRMFKTMEEAISAWNRRTPQ